MSERGLTQEERRCLQLWFRQAIAEVERQEVAAQIIRRHGLTTEEGTAHRSQVARRPAPRGLNSGHRRELVVQ